MKQHLGLPLYEPGYGGKFAPELKPRGSSGWPNPVRSMQGFEGKRKGRNREVPTF